MKNVLKLLKNRTPLGWLQLSHDRARMLTAISGIAFADILIFMQLGFVNALFDSSVKLHEKRNLSRWKKTIGGKIALLVLFSALVW